MHARTTDDASAAEDARDTGLLLAGSGLFMAAYLLLRPYGDQAGDHVAARAMASDWWVVSHVCGMVALVAFVRAVDRATDGARGRGAVLARASAWVGLVLVLPYYGAETFALHEVARRATDPGGGSLELIADIREQPVAMTMFGAGLLLLAASGVALAKVWQSRHRSRAAWPLGLLMALFLPQFFLVDAGRMAYGIAYLAAALLLAVAVRRSARRVATDGGALSEPPATIAR